MSEAVHFGRDFAVTLSLVNEKIFDGPEKELPKRIVKQVTSELGIEQSVVEANKTYQNLCDRFCKEFAIAVAGTPPILWGIEWPEAKLF